MSIWEKQRETSTDFAEKELLKLIEEELAKLVDEMMLADLSEALATATEDTWISLVKGGLYMWLEDQQQRSTSKTLLSEEAIILADEMANMTQILDNDELRTFVNKRVDMLKHEKRLPLLNERFRKLIADEYIRMEEKATAAAKKSGKSLLDEMISLLVGRVIMLAKEEHDKLARQKSDKVAEVKTFDTLDAEQMKVISLDLVKLSEEEFMTHVSEVMNQLIQWGVEEFDVTILVQLYLLVKQELFALVARTSIKATLKERRNIAGYGLSRILEGDITSIEKKSVFDEVFVSLAEGLVILTEVDLASFNDDNLRKFVKKEFEELNYENMEKLRNDGYTKFIIDEFIKLSYEPQLATNESGQLLLDNIIALFAEQLFWFADDEMKMIGERLSKLRVDESNKHVLAFQTMVQSMKGEVHKYEEDKLLKLCQLVEQELFMTTAKSLGKFTEEEIIELVEEGLSKLLAGDIFKSTDEKSIFENVFISLAGELSKLTEEEFTNLKDDELDKLVKSKLQMVNDLMDRIEIFVEWSLKLIVDEFIKLVKEGTISVTAKEDGKHQFGEMVKLIADKLLKVAGK